MKREALTLLLVALVVRLFGAWSLGGGAPFGPDGTGLEAAVHVSGHLYPAHVALLQLFRDAQLLSVLTGCATALMLWAYGHRLGFGGAGGWLCAALPLAVFPSVLAAGDAPALSVVVGGALLATAPGRVWPFLGGLLAVLSVTVKPIALPALVLLLPLPRSWIGVVVGLFPAMHWLKPLWSPLPGGGLLGTWWVASDGAPPPGIDGWIALFRGGVAALLTAPLWALVPLVLLALCRYPASVGPLLAALAVACAFGDRLQARYLAAPVVAALPWVGRRLPAWAMVLLLPLTYAVLSQVAAERAARDPMAEVPALPVLSWPPVDAAAIFEDASTDDATALLLTAQELAATLPHGATVKVQRRPHGREGELTWPLRVARDDVHIQLVDPGTPGAH